MADASKRGSRLVLAFVVVASVAVIFAWHSRPVPRQGWRTILEEPGVPAARRGMELSRRGRQLLSPHERQEMDRLYAEALQNLPEHERQVFAVLSQSEAEASARDLEHSATLIQKSVHSLSPEKQDRLFGLIEKAVRLQYEKEQGER